MKKLKKGEVICDECDGTGKLKKYKYTMVEHQHIKYKQQVMCSKCLGDGKLDWVENVTGKKKNLDEQIETMRKLIKNGKVKLKIGK